MSGGAKELARASLSAAAGTAALYVGSLLPTGRLVMLCVASMGVAFVKMSCSDAWALGCFAVTAALSLLLLPDKTLAVLYTAFVGYYPLIKLRSERFSSRIKRWGLKLGSFLAAELALWALADLIAPAGELFGGRAVWVVLIAGVGAFLVYDYALGLLFLYYLRRISGRIK